MRFDHVYEVDPALMTEHTPQQEIPAWDTQRIVESRWEHLAWMHDHFADSVVSGEELIWPRSRPRKGPIGGDGMKFSYVTLPDYPLADSIEMIKTADELGYYACYSADETWHKDLWVLFAAAADKTKNIRFGPSVAAIGLQGADAHLPGARDPRRAHRRPGGSASSRSATSACWPSTAWTGRRSSRSRGSRRRTT